MTEPSPIDALRRRIAELEQSLERQARIQDALRGSRFLPGRSFFDLLCLELAQTCGADAALVGTLLPGGRSIRTVGLFVDGSVAPGFEYALEGTPCDNVIGKDVCTYPSGITALFPEDKLLQEMRID